MWFFLGRKKKQPQEPGNRHSLTRQDLIAGLGDFSDLETEGVALKFWLPEAMEDVLEELAIYYHVSVSLMVRILLAEYVYGRYAIVFMQEKALGIFHREPDVRFSRSWDASQAPDVYKVPELGKNIAPIKVWIPVRLKDDLGVLASHADVLLSRFVREIIIGSVLGRGTLPERPELHAQPTLNSDAWEQGQLVPMREVRCSEIRELRDYEIETC
jgi:hypothetical protein